MHVPTQWGPGIYLQLRRPLKVINPSSKLRFTIITRHDDTSHWRTPTRIPRHLKCQGSEWQAAASGHAWDGMGWKGRPQATRTSASGESSACLLLTRNDYWGFRGISQSEELLARMARSTAAARFSVHLGTWSCVNMWRARLPQQLSAVSFASHSWPRFYGESERKYRPDCCFAVTRDSRVQSTLRWCDRYVHCLYAATLFHPTQLWHSTHTISQIPDPSIPTAAPTDTLLLLGWRALEQKAHHPSRPQSGQSVFVPRNNNKI